MSPDYRSILLDKVERLVRGEWSVSEFRDRYYFYFLDQVPEHALADRDYDFFARLQENLDWTDERPDRQSRDAGWGDHEQYVAWAERALEALRTGGSVPQRW